MAVLTYKCPNCGGPLVFEPQSQKFGCEYCAGRFAKEELDCKTSSAADKGTEKPASATGDMGAAVYSCPSCGAEVVTKETTAATYCYYCHNPVILSGRLGGAFRPDAVIPFAVEKEEAVLSFLNWVKKKRFVPREFFSKKQIEKLTGVYFPYWIVDCEARGAMDARATNVRAWTSGKHRHVETQHYRVTREGALHFEHIPKNALKKANRKLIEGVLPFDDAKIQSFSTSYLSGFQAEKRDVEREELQDEVVRDVTGFSETILRQTVCGYSSVVPSDTRCEVTGESWKYALFPVWVLTYRAANKKMYYFAMNGQDGKVCGQLPVDRGRLLVLFASVAAPLFLLLLAGGYML